MIRACGCLPFILFCLTLFANLSYSEEKGVFLTEEIQLKVADALVAQGEYYRAITEYKKFLILFPDSVRTDYVLGQMGMAYYKGEEYAAAVKCFSDLIQKNPQSEYAPKAGYFEALSYWKLKKYEDSRAAFSRVAETYPQSEYAPLSLIAGSLLGLEREDTEASRKSLDNLVDRYPGDPASKNAKEARELLAKYRDLPQKSRALAGVMSAVVPGSGYMYAEHYGDGITALIINALFIAGTVIAVSGENYAVAGIVAGVGLPFYIGNIYGSANAANKWNIGVRRDFRDRIFLTLDFKF